MVLSVYLVCGRSCSTYLNSCSTRLNRFASDATPTSWLSGATGRTPPLRNFVGDNSKACCFQPQWISLPARLLQSVFLMLSRSCVLGLADRAGAPRQPDQA